MGMVYGVSEIMLIMVILGGRLGWILSPEEKQTGCQGRRERRMDTVQGAVATEPRSLAGNPDSLQIAVFVTAIVDVTVGF